MQATLSDWLPLSESTRSGTNSGELVSAASILTEHPALLGTASTVNVFEAGQ